MAVKEAQVVHPGEEIRRYCTVVADFWVQAQKLRKSRKKVQQMEQLIKSEYIFTKTDQIYEFQERLSRVWRQYKKGARLRTSWHMQLLGASREPRWPICGARPASRGTALPNEIVDSPDLNVIKSKTRWRKWYHDARQAHEKSQAATSWLAKLQHPAKYSTWSGGDSGPGIWIRAAGNCGSTRCCWKYR